MRERGLDPDVFRDRCSFDLESAFQEEEGNPLLDLFDLPDDPEDSME